MTLNKQELETLEHMLDGTNLAVMLEALSDICYGKSQHIEEAWQDQPLAKAWARDAAKLATAASKVTVR